MQGPTGRPGGGVGVGPPLPRVGGGGGLTPHHHHRSRRKFFHGAAGAGNFGFLTFRTPKNPLKRNEIGGQNKKYPPKKIVEHIKKQHIHAKVRKVGIYHLGAGKFFRPKIFGSRTYLKARWGGWGVDPPLPPNFG